MADRDKYREPTAEESDALVALRDAFRFRGLVADVVDGTRVVRFRMDGKVFRAELTLESK
jgi:hypothetical protein